MGFITFANQRRAGEGPTEQLETGEGAKQAHGVFGVGFMADAGAFAALDLVAEAGFAGGGFVEAEQGVAEIMFGSQGAQYVVGFLGGFEQAIAGTAQSKVEFICIPRRFCATGGCGWAASV